MAFTVPNEGELVSLARLLNKTATVNLRCRLFTNNVTPTETATVASFTQPGAGFGYASATCLAAAWTMRNSGGISLGSATKTFTFTSGAVSVYGAILTDGTVCVFAEKFSDGPYNVPVGGGTITVTLKPQLA